MTDTETPTADVPTTVISAEMQAAIGTEIARRVSYPVTDSDIRRWALAVYWPEQPPERYLGGGEGSTLVAPEEFNPFAWAVAESVVNSAGGDRVENDPDHIEKQLGLAGPGLPFQLNGGLQAEYEVPIRVGDVITSVSRLASYSEHTGRLGLMLVTVIEDTWTNQDGELVKRGRYTGIRY